MVAALGLALVGTVQNGWFAQSMGATPVAGTLFLILGVASDAIALVLPSVCRQGMASPPAESRAGRVAGLARDVQFRAGLLNRLRGDEHRGRHHGPRVTGNPSRAQTALGDAMLSRDLECKTETGKFCREREAEVQVQRLNLDAATQSVGRAADPQTMAAVKLVSWVTAGAISPSENDFGMLRLMLPACCRNLAASWSWSRAHEVHG
jgi:hypothetical protein